MPTFNYTSDKPYKNAAFSKKRRVILTDFGWVNRIVKGTRIIDEQLVAGHPGSWNAATIIPRISEVYCDKSSYAAGSNGVMYLVMTEAMKLLGGNLKATIANTTAGAVIVPTCQAANSVSLTLYANNVLAFPFVAAVVGTYTVQAQTLANATATAVILNSQNSDNAAANLQIIASALSANTVFTVV